MEKFAKNAAIVITFLKENHYSEQTVHNYEKIYNSAQVYLNQKGVIYSPETGEQMLDQQEDSFFGIKGAFIRASSIRKINAVYLYGELKELQISPHRKCHRVSHSQEFERAISDFMKSCRETFSTTQQGNISRRIKLFFQYLQLTGISVLEKISYEIIVSYHCHLLTLNLKPISRTLEESSVYQMLDFLAKEDRIPYGVSLCMLLISKGDLVTMDVFSSVERRKLECIRHMDQMLSSEAFLAAGKALLQEHMEAGYVPASCRTFERTVIHFYVFLDMNGLGYLPEIADIWLNCNVVKHAFQGSSWKAAKRFLNIFRDSVMNGQPDFYKVYRKGITGLQDLPDWCRVPLMKFTELRIRQKLEPETVKNDIYSILRFIRFLLREGIQSYMELTGELLVQFNLSDVHGSPEGKNACNARIRRFLRYLGREGLLRSTCLFMSLAATTATVETVVVTFTEDEIHSIRDYVASASTPVEIRDSAIIMIGCDMGIRGCDIANLRVGDINWKDQCIHFRQDKTDADVVVGLTDQAVLYISRAMNWRAEFDGSPKRIEVPEVPVKAIREAVINAFVHRLIESRQAVDIAVYKSFIDVYSPGLFPQHLEPEQFIQHIIKPPRRNPLITKTLYYSKDMEALATGFIRIDEECTKAGVRYEFIKDPYGFTVRFYRHCGEGWNSDSYLNQNHNQHQDQHLGSNSGADSETDGVDWEERKQMIVSVLKDDPSISRGKISKKTGLTVRQVERALDLLKEEKRIKREGPAHGGKWIVSE